MGSGGDADLLVEDFNSTKKMRATGYIGRNSEVAWAQSLANAQVEGQDDRQSNEMAYGDPGTSQDAMLDRMTAAKMRQSSGRKNDTSIADFTYHLDMEDVLAVEFVNKDELPPTALAIKLLDCYMKTVGDTWPILAKSEFLAQFQQYLRSKNPQGLPVTWRALLNMVFAIGAKFSHLTSASWKGDDRDHIVYYTRALSLNFPRDAIVAHPDIQRIQVLGLISFYYLAISQVNRSWVMIGVACRHAIGLGLHLRNMHPDTNARSKEKRVCVWWSLYYLEYLLCEITGRPTAIDRRFYSTLHPAPINEAYLANPPGATLLEAWNRTQGASETTSSTTDKRNASDLDTDTNSANRFRCHVQLAVLSQKVLVSLYSAETVTKSWKCVQEEMIALREELDQWYRSLPTQYQFTHSNDDETFCRERIQLAFGYYSAIILLDRPCLCRVDERIQEQGDWSKKADAARARECVMAAKSMSDLLPNMVVPDIIWIYTNGPWWCIVHHFMQAITVLMLSLALEKYHIVDPAIDQEEILQTAQKLICWLVMMASKGNDSAISACKQAKDQFKEFAHFENINLAQPQSQPPRMTQAVTRTVFR